MHSKCKNKVLWTGDELRDYLIKSDYLEICTQFNSYERLTHLSKSFQLKIKLKPLHFVIKFPEENQIWVKSVYNLQGQFFEGQRSLFQQHYHFSCTDETLLHGILPHHILHVYGEKIKDYWLFFKAMNYQQRGEDPYHDHLVGPREFSSLYNMRLGMPLSCPD